MLTRTGPVSRPRRRAAGSATALAAAAMLVALVAVPAAAAPRSGVSSASSSTVWLCRPGQRPDPCAYPRAATAVTGSGATSASTELAPLRSAQKFDCFYVYPTVSTEQTNNANLAVQPAELAVAASQASRFSQVCRVWAPMYRQATVPALARGAITSPTVSNIAYASLLAGWRDYLRHDNDGRPIVFIGHSQGAAILIRLLRTQIDPSPRLRRQLVSAIILGGNVQVPTGARVGGSFQHIPTCASATVDGLRHRLLDLRVDPAPSGSLRAARARGQRPVRADQTNRSAGGLRQSGDLLQRQRARCSPTSCPPAPRCRASP